MKCQLSRVHSPFPMIKIPKNFFEGEEFKKSFIQYL